MTTRTPPRRTRSAACLCAACGRVVDAADETCAKCGLDRPAAGWKPLGLPRREAAPEPAPDDTFDLAGPPDEPGNVVSLGTGLPLREAALPVPTKATELAPPPEPASLVPAPPSPSPPASRRRPMPLRVQVAPPDAADTPVDDAVDVSARPYAGRYRVEETLPSASGATRHVAVQEPAVRRVILTVLRRGRPADVQQALESRFLRDARVLARLRHPCLAAVHDVGRAADGTCYATEETPYGPTFRELAAARALPPERLLAVAANLAAALATMHEAGVVHRCVRGDAVVVGHGVWRNGAGGELTQLGRYGWHVLPEEVGDDDVESALTWPPEVLAGEEPDEAADIYAVGVLLHHGLVGRPLHAGTAAEIRAATARGPVHRLVRTGDRLTNRLCDVAERCLAPSPDHRYPSARALLRELEELARPPAPEVRPVATGLSFPGVAAAALAGALVPTLALLAGAAWRASDRPDTPGERPALAAAAPAAAGAGAAGVAVGDPAAVRGPGTVGGPGAVGDDAGAASAATAGAAAAAAEGAAAGAEDSANPAEATAPAGSIASTSDAAPAVTAATTPAGAVAAPAEAAAAERRPTRLRSRSRASAPAGTPATPAAVPTASPAVAAASSTSGASAGAVSTAANAPSGSTSEAGTPPADGATRVSASASSASAPRPAASADATAAPARGSAGVSIPGAAALSGLWVGRAPGGTLALDLVVGADGRVTGRARRGDRAGEGVVVGRVSGAAGALRLELQVTDASGTESYSGEVVDGAVSGRIYAGGKPAGRFTAKR